MCWADVCRDGFEGLKHRLELMHVNVVQGESENAAAAEQSAIRERSDGNRWTFMGSAVPMWGEVVDSEKDENVEILHRSVTDG